MQLTPAHSPGAQADGEVAALIEKMRIGVAQAPEIFRPGEFWDELIAVNLEMLRTDGIANFKRTVSNNYYNWLVTSLRDPQMQRAIVEWLRHPTLAPLLNRLDQPPTGLRTTDRQSSYSLSRVAAWRYKFFVGSIWETARRQDTRGLADRLSEPEAGNPIRLTHRGRLISQDLANSIIEMTFAAGSGAIRDGSRVAELGAGYGRLAYVFANAFDLTYCIFDIPPALAVSQWYLTEVLGEERIRPYSNDQDFATVVSELKPGVVAFFTPDQLEMFPDGWFDCTQTISTLPEMPARQSARYLELLAEKSRRAVFLKQWRQWRNERDNVDLREEDYQLPAPWRLASRRVDPVQPAFFNHLWLRDTPTAGSLEQHAAARARQPAREESPSCPLCGGGGQPAFRTTDRNRGIPSGSLQYHRCLLCRSLYLLPVPEDLGRFYPAEYHGYPDRGQLDLHARAEQPKLELLQRAVRSGRLLEIGSGAGFFCRAAVLSGFDVTAIEMDEDCCRYIADVVGARAICSARPESALNELGSFEAIAMWHVIEHLPDPWVVFEAAVAHLAPGGAIIVGTPNPDSIQFRLLGARWAHVDAPRHLFLIPEATLRSKAAELGLVHVLSTTSDPAGRYWNRFGWEYALRRYPAEHPSTLLTRALSLAITTAVRPLESRGLAGATYTSLFVRPAE